MSEPLHYRRADRTDVTALTALEERCFSSDRLSRRSFQRMVATDRAWLAVAEQDDGALLGYALVLFHRGTSLARLYSIAVDPSARGRGIAETLLQRAEQAAAARGRVFMRLEVNSGNHGAIHLYEKLGYQRFGIHVDYYADHADALRLQKRIATYPHDADHRSLPYYAQTTEFTCGPAALMMAMAALDPGYQASRREELQLWREATTIYMTSGHGGCGPHGLALAAWRRGFRAHIHVSQLGPLFVEGVRRSEKKQVLEQVHGDFLAQLESSDVELSYSAADIGVLRRAIAAAAVPLVLISSWRYDRKKAPHWVVVTAIDERFVYIHDPDVDDKSNRHAFDCQYLPIEIASFLKSMQFGQQRLRAALLVWRRPATS